MASLYKSTQIEMINSKYEELATEVTKIKDLYSSVVYPIQPTPPVNSFALKKSNVYVSSLQKGPIKNPVQAYLNMKRLQNPDISNESSKLIKESIIQEVDFEHLNNSLANQSRFSPLNNIPNIIISKDVDLIQSNLSKKMQIESVQKNKKNPKTSSNGKGILKSSHSVSFINKKISDYNLENKKNIGDSIKNKEIENKNETKPKDIFYPEENICSFDLKKYIYYNNEMCQMWIRATSLFDKTILFENKDFTILTECVKMFELEETQINFRIQINCNDPVTKFQIICHDSRVVTENVNDKTYDIFYKCNREPFAPSFITISLSVISLKNNYSIQLPIPYTINKLTQTLLLTNEDVQTYLTLVL